MSSLSNLYKGQINQSRNSIYTRVIDYNELLEQKLSALTFEQETKLSRHGGQLAEVPRELEIDYVEQAKEQADQMIAKASADAEQILKRAVEEAENLKEAARAQAEEEGYAQAMQRVQAEEAKLREAWEQQRLQQEQAYEKRLEEMEPELMDAVIEVFDKVLQTDFAGRRKILLHLIRSTVRHIKNSREFRIRVSEQDYDTIAGARDEIFKKIGGEVVLDIVLDESMQPGQCTIDTDEGLFDCGLDVQLENLTKDLKALACMD